MTHNEKVLRILSDRRPHTHHELYALNVVAHSRVSELRRRGHVIHQWRVGDDYLYRLVSSPSPGGVLTAAAPSLSPSGGAAQLSLLEAVA